MSVRRERHQAYITEKRNSSDVLIVDVVSCTNCALSVVLTCLVLFTSSVTEYCAVFHYSPLDVRFAQSF